MYISRWNLSASAIVTVGGRVTDIFGRRWFLIAGALLGMLGALVGALGRSIPQMIVAGVLMGCGGGFQEIIFACVQEVVPNKRRLLALGMFRI
jgi:MFS family permease